MTDDESALLPWPPCPRPGWTELYGRMIEQLRAVDPDISPQRDGVYVGEGLTVLVRTTAGHDSVWPILCRAAEASLRTCEVCGRTGEWREEIDGNPVLCNEHTETTRWPRIDAAPGWQVLYRKLRADVAALDPRAQVSVRQKMGRLHVHAAAADSSVLQAIRDLCLAAEGESTRTCLVCGAAGTLRGIGEPRWVRPLCDKHNEMYTEAELHAVLRAADNPSDEPYFAPRSGWMELRNTPGWEPLYRRLQADIAELDPDAQVQVLQRPHRLHLHVVAANPATQQAIRDLCFEAEAASLRICQVCGEPGEVRNLAKDQSRWRVRCDAHAEGAGE